MKTSIENEQDINLNLEEQDEVEQEDKPSLLDVLADIAEVISCFFEIVCLLLGKGD